MFKEREAVIKKLIFGTRDIKKIIPGFVFALLLMISAYILSSILENIIPKERNYFSPILISIILGLLVRNIFGLHNQFEEGIKFGIKKLLRLGIMLMGLRLSIFAVLKIGILAVGLVAICIASALIIALLLGQKLKVSKRIRVLIAAGTSICGVSAIVATAPVIEADEEETTYAIGTITIIGLITTLLYPYITELIMNLNVVQSGFFIGTSVHDTSQVTGTALIYDQLWGNKSLTGLTGSDIAITTKLVRNTFMIIVIPLLGVLFRKKENGMIYSSKFNILQYIPLFVLGYLGFGVVRTLGDYVFGSSNQEWINIWRYFTSLAKYIIAVSITCVGLNTNISKLVKLGIKPFATGLIVTISVGGVSWLLLTIFKSFLYF